MNPQVTSAYADLSGMILVFSAGSGDDESLSTPFEEWCASMDLHPEDSRAWPLYVHSVGVEEDHTPAAS